MTDTRDLVTGLSSSASSSLARFPQFLWCPASLLLRCVFTLHTLSDDLISLLYVTRPGRRAVFPRLSGLISD